MELSISNLAWQPKDDEQMASLLKQHQIAAIDIAPSKYFANIPQISEQAIENLRLWWHQRQIRLVGMQSLLFALPQVNLFGPKAMRQDMLIYLGHVCRLAAGLGIKKLTFGSPKQRDRGLLTYSQAAAIALPFFRQLGDIAAAQHVQICIEGNPACYGCNFMTDTLQAAEVVQQVDHPAIRLQLDTGTMLLANEQPSKLLPSLAPLIGHIHLSAPQLQPPSMSDPLHQQLAPLLLQWLPELICTIEMSAPHDNPWVSFAHTLQTTCSRYGAATPTKHATHPSTWSKHGSPS